MMMEDVDMEVQNKHERWEVEMTTPCQIRVTVTVLRTSPSSTWVTVEAATASRFLLSSDVVSLSSSFSLFVAL